MKHTVPASAALAALCLALFQLPLQAAGPAEGSPAVPEAVRSPAYLESARALVGRLLPARAGEFVCEAIPAVAGKDVYEIESRDGKIILRGSSGVAIASGLYHYLKEECHCHVSWNGDQLNLPQPLPPVPGRVREVAAVETKFAYNYCTHGYTMAWWDWPQWERELDWLALHGINMALVIEGQEAVWQNTFVKFGYTQEEVRQWLCSPVHQPWQYMQNMQGVLPPSQAIIDKRVALGQKIVRRCRELGIRPVLQGFYGMVPSGFAAKFPEAKIVDQGGWAGGNHRPDMLHIQDPRFVPVATAFLEEQQKLFGECHYFAADPFHEGGRPGDMKRGEVYKVIQDAILKFDPQATVVKQCWQTSNKEMFDAGRKDRSLALDLWCDYSPFWPRCNGYDGTPWVWCCVLNFGGNSGMEGNLAKLAKDFGSTLADPKRGRMAGLAFVPEGSHMNPAVYELLTEMGWRGAPEDMPLWVGRYLQARYGKVDPAASAAWSLMLETNYGLTSGESPVNSIACSAPRLDDNIRGRTWCPGTKIPYDNRKLAAAWGKLLEAAPSLQAADPFRYDLADACRQTISNLGRPIYDRMRDAYQIRDEAAFKLQSQRLLESIDDLEAITATRPEWLMGKWVQDARAWGDTDEDRKYADLCARMLLTTWMPNPHTDLNDYANREWSGLLGRYYRQRWGLFVTALADDLDGKRKFNPNEFARLRGEFEKAWVAGQEKLPAEPQGDTVAVARRLYAKYAPLVQEYAPKPGRLADGKWDPATLRQAQEFSWDVSRQVRSPGIYAVKFQWKSGSSALVMDSLSLVVNGQSVHTDEHPGWTGVENKHNIYYLKAISVPPNAVVEVKIQGMRALSGADSAGEISLEKLK